MLMKNKPKQTKEKSTCDLRHVFVVDVVMCIFVLFSSFFLLCGSLCDHGWHFAVEICSQHSARFISPEEEYKNESIAKGSTQKTQSLAFTGLFFVFLFVIPDPNGQ